MKEFFGDEHINTVTRVFGVTYQIKLKNKQSSGLDQNNGEALILPDSEQIKL